LNCKFHFLYFTLYEELLHINSNCHNSYEIVYYLKGTGETVINGCSYKYKEGTFSIILPDIYHSEIHEEKTEVIYINFDCIDLPFEILNGVYFDSYSKTILNLMEKIKKEIISKNIFHEYRLELLIQELLIEHKRIIENKNSKNEWLDYVVVFIDENYNNGIKMETLAEISGYSYHRFRHLFKEKTGLSPIAYILSKKIEHSKERLTNSSLGVTEISNICGFSNSSQFSNLFKKYTGLSPREYRKN